MLSECDHISVCICTFKRPQLLLHLLREIGKQKAANLFTYEIVLVDNDYACSAKPVADHFTQEFPADINYFCEPEQNIALARNRAVQNAKGNLIAFIDDDEFPDEHWLFNLYKTFFAYKADGVLGPVKPHFETAPPQWILKGKICERKSFKTGTFLRNSRDTRTGNVLLSKNLFKEKEAFFNPVFGKTGGEDVDFFRRMIEKDHVFIWCDEAPVYENVPPERCKRSYFLKRALLRGMVHSNDPSLKVVSILKSVIAFFVYTVSLPFLFIAGDHLFMKYFIKDCDHIGKIIGICGIKFVKERAF